MQRAVVTLIVWVAAALPGLDDDWGDDMFDHTSHNFGTVARGQKVEHRFPLENIYEEDICIRSVTSSCRCLKPKIPKDRLKMYEKGEIRVVIDTVNFRGRKDGTLKVKLHAMMPDGPSPEEVQLHCYVYIRGDVVVQPGTVRFDSCRAGGLEGPQGRECQPAFGCLFEGNGAERRGPKLASKL
ncbi:MAG: DUF1573 domain-containing protein [Planctomycetota bacterium]|jgi:hypothetical protein